MTDRIRIHRRADDDGGFAQIPNETLRDPRLSWTALGLLAEILSRPDNWSASAARMHAQRRGFGVRSEGIRRIRAAFRQLEACGYMRRAVVRGPHGRIATELHFYDVSAGRTDCAVTDSRWTGMPVTEASVTERSVTVQSLRTPSTNTEKNTDHEHPLSLGGELPHLDGLADDEREPFAHWVIGTAGSVRSPRPYLRSIPAADLAALLADWRTGGAAAAPRPPWCSECDERTRLIGDPPGRCPECHPLAGRDVREAS